MVLEIVSFELNESVGTAAILPPKVSSGIWEMAQSFLSNVYI